MGRRGRGGGRRGPQAGHRQWWSVDVGRGVRVGGSGPASGPPNPLRGLWDLCCRIVVAFLILWMLLMFLLKGC